jgi:alginate O-acetyltransferase complex protein AlgI
MSYLSIEFALSFTVFLGIYWCFSRSPKWQNVLLLLASYAFYICFDWRFAAILAGYTTLLHLLIRQMAQAGRPQRWLHTGLVMAVLCLSLFKYFDFFRLSAQSLLHLMGAKTVLPGIELLMPVGISFYIFQSITYLVSVYRKEVEPARLDQLALFLAFFPTLLSGPICRATDLLQQLRNNLQRSIVHADRALMLILLALIKKLWLASWLANAWVDPVFAAPDTFHPLEVWAACYAYALQIYLDFSGYTDLVTALALLMGITLPQNFNAPYQANNLRDFWRRWHISLSTWIRDYVYVPLGGSRKGPRRTQLNVVAAMVISGFWHGASIKFLLWGGIHGLGLATLNLMDLLCGRDRLSRFSPWLARFLTFNFVSFAWIFFRSASLEDAGSFLSAMVHTGQPMTMNAPGLLLLILAALLMLSQIRSGHEKLERGLARMPWWGKTGVLTCLALCVIELSPAGIPGFIYFQF